VPADAELPSGETSVLGKRIKETPCIIMYKKARYEVADLWQGLTCTVLQNVVTVCDVTP